MVAVRNLRADLALGVWGGRERESERDGGVGLNKFVSEK